jgi:rare lipoprotein A
MSKHFAAAFIAASTLLAATSHGALARTPSHRVRPIHVAQSNRHSVHAHARVVHASYVHAAYVEAAAPADTSAWVGEVGKASYYGPAYNGRRAANGLRFDQTEMTAAHQWLPFGTKVRVVLAGTDRSVIVTITDRIYSSRRVLDLSVAAARELGIIRSGVANVTLNPV